MPKASTSVEKDEKDQNEDEIGQKDANNIKTDSKDAEKPVEKDENDAETANNGLVLANGSAKEPIVEKEKSVKDESKAADGQNAESLGEHDSEPSDRKLSDDSQNQFVEGSEKGDD